MQSMLTFRYKFISSRTFHIFDNRCDIQQAQWEVVKNNYISKKTFFLSGVAYSVLLQLQNSSP